MPSGWASRGKRIGSSMAGAQGEKTRMTVDGSQVRGWPVAGGAT